MDDRKFSFSLCVFLTILFSLNALADSPCSQLSANIFQATKEDKANLANRKNGLKEVLLSWSICENQDRYQIKIKTISGKVYSRELNENQKKLYSTKLILKQDSKYFISLERISQEGALIEKSEVAVDIPAERHLASVGESVAVPELETAKKTKFNLYAGPGYIDYDSDISFEVEGFELPVVQVGFNTTFSPGFGLNLDLQNSFGRRSIATQNEILNYFNITSDIFYRIGIGNEWHFTPFVLFSQQSVKESFRNEASIVNSLTHFGAGGKLGWGSGGWNLDASASYSPYLGSNEGLSRWEGRIISTHDLGDRFLLRLPLTYFKYSGNTSFGSNSITAFQAGAGLAYAF